MCGSGGTVCIHVYIVLQYYLNCLIMFLTFYYIWGFNTFLTGIIKSLFTAICLDRGTQQHVEEEWAYIFFVKFLDDCFDGES